MHPERHPERHPDDLPPVADPIARRPRLPAGLGWALALGLVTLSIAAWMVNDSGDGEPATVLDRSIPVPPDHATATPADAVTDTRFEYFDGTAGSLTELADRPVVVNFWASWCVPCLTEMPDLQQVHLEWGDEVAFVGLNVRDGEAPARRLADQTGVTYPLGWDRDGAILRELGGVSLPTTVVVAPGGAIHAVHTGVVRPDDLNRLLEKVGR